LPSRRPGRRNGAGHPAAVARPSALKLSPARRKPSSAGRQARRWGRPSPPPSAPSAVRLTFERVLAGRTCRAPLRCPGRAPRHGRRYTVRQGPRLGCSAGSPGRQPNPLRRPVGLVAGGWPRCYRLLVAVGSTAAVASTQRVRFTIIGS
jgi:hypothetical protein